MPRRPTDQTIQRAVGSRLAAARRTRGMTQEALAGVLGIEPGTLSRYEQGRVPLTVPLLVLAAKAIGVHPAQVLEGAIEGQEAPTAVGEEAELLALWRGVGAKRREAIIRLLREVQG